MKKIFRIIVIITCIIILTGCNNNDEILINNSLKKYTHDDLMTNSYNTNINEFLNDLFNEINFDGLMYLIQVRFFVSTLIRTKNLCL